MTPQVLGGFHAPAALWAAVAQQWRRLGMAWKFVLEKRTGLCSLKATYPPPGMQSTYPLTFFTFSWLSSLCLGFFMLSLATSSKTSYTTLQVSGLALLRALWEKGFFFLCHSWTTHRFRLSDWLFGEQPEEVVVNYCEAKDKFVADWCPETSPELEAMARAEEKKVIDRDFLKAPAIWFITTEQQAHRSGPRVMFGKRTWSWCTVLLNAIRKQHYPWTEIWSIFEFVMVCNNFRRGGGPSACVIA